MWPAALVGGSLKVQERADSIAGWEGPVEEERRLSGRNREGSDGVPKDCGEAGHNERAGAESDAWWVEGDGNCDDGGAARGCSADQYERDSAVARFARHDIK
jgi:hypothetical protein